MRLTLSIIFMFTVGSVLSQEFTSYKTKKIKIKKSGVVNPKLLPSTFDASLTNHEAPVPGGSSEKSYILQQKIKSKKIFSARKKHPSNKSGDPAALPSVVKGFGLFKKVGENRYPFYGGVPNDNSLAISKEGIALLGVNSSVYAYNVNTDSILFSTGTISLQSMASPAVVGFRFFDPKIIYDKAADRFILVFLKNSDPDFNEVVICFSTTNNPNDSWNVYALPGNPLNNNRWTDFPAISITETDLFFTGNLIKPSVSWQTGFDGSIIWQIEKQKGYAGDPTLNTVFYNDIKYGGNFVRNLHPVQGADGAIDELYLLSNRNFDLSNDSIFVGHIEGTSVDAATKLTMAVYQSDISYGMPPNGRQQDTDTLDPTSGLQTNDARVLGAIKIGEDVQFVSNTINPVTGYAGIYHGTISSIADQPAVTASIIGDTVKDYGYANLAWTGNEPCDKEVIISFNYSSFTDFPGISCVYFDNDGNYSEEKVIKEGENYVDRLSGGYERWGDYFGLQRDYAEPGKVFSFGYYGALNSRNAGWCAALVSPDSSRMELSIERIGQAASCNQEITVSAMGGVPPYTYNWLDDPSHMTSSLKNVCLGDSAAVTIIDSRGCQVEGLVYGESIQLSGLPSVYPNPFSHRFAVQFTIATDQEIFAKIYDLSGRMVADLLQRNAKKGLNELVFSLLPLQVGQYILVVEGGGKEIINQKIVKNE